MSHIIIETEKTDYTGGDVVNGHFSVHIDEAVPARGIRVRFHGYEKAHWTSGSGKNRTTHDQTRDFFNDELTVFGQEKLSMSAVLADAVSGIFSKDRYEILQPGTYEYDFSYTLPFDLPGDFEYRSSRIAYEIKAYVDIPLKVDISATQKLTIYEPYNPEEIASLSGEKSKRLLFDPGNPIEMSATIDRNMCFPGEEVHGELAVTNNSSKTIEAIKVTLKRIVKLKAHGSSLTATDKSQLLEVEQPAIQFGLPTTLDLTFQIPGDLYCSVTTTRLVRVYYELLIDLDLPWAKDARLKFPITILEEGGMPSGVAR